MSFDPVDWLTAKGVRLKPGPCWMLQYLFRYPERCPDVGRWMVEVRINRSVGSGWMRKKRLPGLQAWVVVAGCLAVRRAMLEEPNVSLDQLAWRHGLSDRSVLTHRFRRSFGLTARESMECGEVELMERWWSMVQGSECGGVRAAV